MKATMKFRIILFFTLSLVWVNSILARESDDTDDIQVRIENLERKVFSQTNNNQGLIT